MSDVPAVDEPIIRLEGVHRTFRVGHREVLALAGVDLQIQRGRTMAIVGESGSGKTTLGNLILGIDRPSKGEIWFGDRKISGPRDRDLCRRITVVQQNPYSTLNPRRTVGQSVALPIITHSLRPRRDRRGRVAELLEIVGLSPEHINRDPGGLSGGQRQLVALARALASEPEVIVLDEPTSSLDVSIQAKILLLLLMVQRQYGITSVLITHDLSVVRNIAHDVAVLYRGRLVEVGSTHEVFSNPRHRYTSMLLASIPVVSSEEELLRPDWPWDESSSEGETSPANACPFIPRCPFSVSACADRFPQSVSVSATHRHFCCNPHIKVT